ncbi:MAG: Tm-1-like ATP-binding domain-containing protein [Legionellaceae bacterium]|nr:Tm-1-like ATP-binding domain-containing protein [Legionellaceae bacterium]
MKKIWIAATFDTKFIEANYLKDLLLELNLPVMTADISTSTNHNFSTDISAKTIASFHEESIEKVFCGDRGKSVSAMESAFTKFVLSRNDIGAIIGIGGSGGTSIITPAMQALPIGLPKIMLSTMASGDVSNYIGASDISMMYSVTDFVGLNSISRKILANAAGAISGAFIQSSKKNIITNDREAIGITMFGVTTACVQQIKERLDKHYDCIVFHATGTGGQSMEKLLDNGFFKGILDITTTEVCDYMFGGVLACSEDRFGAIARTKKPAVISCGALDMVNFGAISSIPDKYKKRLLYKHNSDVTLMRTNPEENHQIGEFIANKLNQCQGPIRLIIPEAGLSALDDINMPFWNPKANEALFSSLEKNLIQTNNRKIIRTPSHINSQEFVDVALKQFAEIMINEKANQKELECLNLTE